MKSLACVSLLSLFFVCAGCSDKGEHFVRTYELLNVTEGMDLKFSDLVDEIRIVPLETRDNVLIADSRYVINDKYIIVLGEDAIQQFDAVTGKHIRVLAVAGNGPNEFKGVTSALIKNGKLFYSCYGKNFVSVIDLESGRFLPQLPTTYKNDVSFFGMTDKEEIYMPNDSLLFETFDFGTQTSTPVLDSSRHEKPRNVNALSFVGFSLGGSAWLEDAEGVFLYNSRFSDSLYLKKGGKTEPYAVFLMPVNKNTNNSALRFTSGNELYMGIPFMDSRMYFCGFREMVTEVKGNAVTIFIRTKDLYCIDRKTGDAKIVKKYIFDPLFVTEFPQEVKSEQERESNVADAICGRGNNWFADKAIYATVLPAYKVKEYIRESLGDPDFPAEKVAELQILDSKLTDESNPVVFMGKKR